MLPSKVAGIPCLVEVTSLHIQKPFSGPAHLCDSDHDYYGYEEVEFLVCDRTGRPASWLESKMTADDHDRIVCEIVKFAMGH